MSFCAWRTCVTNFSETFFAFQARLAFLNRPLPFNLEFAVAGWTGVKFVNAIISHPRRGHYNFSHVCSTRRAYQTRRAFPADICDRIDDVLIAQTLLAFLQVMRIILQIIARWTRH